MISVDAAARATSEKPAVLVRVSGLAKAFGATQALRRADFELQAGEVHALVGENGSGKSTLVKILSGVHAADTGSIELAGLEGGGPRTPREAQEHGIVTVFQEVLVAEARELDNVWLGVDGLLRARHARRDLLRRPRILILDEATSALDVATRDRLFRIVGRLSREGAGVIFITHRMDEIREIGDRITVMRSGDTVGVLERGAWTPRELVHLMTGSDRLTEHAREEVEAAAQRRREPVLSSRGLKLRADGRPIDVDIHAGELIGLAGLDGHGQDQFLEALGGAGAVVRRGGRRDVVLRWSRQAAELGCRLQPSMMVRCP